MGQLLLLLDRDNSSVNGNRPARAARDQAMTMQGGLSPARSTGTRLARTTMPVASRSAASKDCAALNPGPKIRHSQRVLIRGIHASIVRLFLLRHLLGRSTREQTTNFAVDQVCRARHPDAPGRLPRFLYRRARNDDHAGSADMVPRVASTDRQTHHVGCHCARERVRCQGTRLWIRGSSGPSRRQQRGSAAPPRRQSFTARVQQRRRCSAGPCVTAWNTPSTSAPLTRSVT